MFNRELKADIKYLREDNRRLHEYICDLNHQLYQLAEAAGLKWKAPEPPGWYKPEKKDA